MAMTTCIESAPAGETLSIRADPMPVQVSLGTGKLPKEKSLQEIGCWTGGLMRQLRQQMLCG
jgi:hypothetical protein